MAGNLKETIDWESAIGKRTGTIPKRRLFGGQDPSSRVFTPDQRRIPAPQATSTLLTKQPAGYFDEALDEAEPDPSQMRPLAETLEYLEKLRGYRQDLKEKERRKVRADYAAGRRSRAEEDAFLAEEFPDMTPRRRRKEKRTLTPRRANKHRLPELHQMREELLAQAKQQNYYLPALYKHHLGKSPTKPGPVPYNKRFMSQMADPALEDLMRKYRSTDEKQKKRSEKILDYMSTRNMDDREFHKTFMENVFSPPPAQAKKIRRNPARPYFSQQAWLERGYVPDIMTKQREAVQRRTAKSREYVEKLKSERQSRFSAVEDRRKRHYEQDTTDDFWLSDDEPDTIAEQISMQEKGVTLDSTPREVVDFAIPEEQLLDLSMVSDQAPHIVAPEAIPTSQLSAMLNRSGDEEQLIDISIDTRDEELLEEGSENFDEIYENAKNTSSPIDSPVSVNLEVREPKTANFLQMRGSEVPSWFPGFHVAIPGDGSKIRCERSPSAAMLIAWRKMQPALLHVF